MISRFFKKKAKAPERKKPAPKKPKPESSVEKVTSSKKLLTAEGWKRMMMRKTNKTK